MIRVLAVVHTHASFNFELPPSRFTCCVRSPCQVAQVRLPFWCLRSLPRVAILWVHESPGQWARRASAAGGVLEGRGRQPAASPFASLAAGRVLGVHCDRTVETGRAGDPAAPVRAPDGQSLGAPSAADPSSGAMIGHDGDGSGMEPDRDRGEGRHSGLRPHLAVEAAECSEGCQACQLGGGEGQGRPGAGTVLLDIQRNGTPEDFEDEKGEKADRPVRRCRAAEDSEHGQEAASAVDVEPFFEDECEMRQPWTWSPWGHECARGDNQRLHAASLRVPG